MSTETAAARKKREAEEEIKPTGPVVGPDDPAVLDLMVTSTRRIVKVPTKAHPEGELLELRLLDDFGISDQQALLAYSRLFEKLWNRDVEDGADRVLTRAERDRLLHTLNKIAHMVLDAPAEVIDDLPEAVRARVVTAFTLAPLIARQEAQAKAEAEEAERLLAEQEAEENSTELTSAS